MKVQPSMTTIIMIIGSIAVTLGSVSIFLSSTYGQNQTQSDSVVEGDIVVDQKTEMSRAAVTTHPHEEIKHQILPILPIREDGKIWSGTITFTASKPVELEILQKYNPDQKPNATHGEPFHNLLAHPHPFLDDIDVAFTLLKDLVDTHLVINGTTISSGTFDFAGTGLVLHQSDGVPFTATYTVDAVAKELVPVNRTVSE